MVKLVLLWFLTYIPSLLNHQVSFLSLCIVSRLIQPKRPSCVNFQGELYKNAITQLSLHMPYWFCPCSHAILLSWCVHDFLCLCSKIIGPAVILDLCTTTAELSWISRIPWSVSPLLQKGDTRGQSHCITATDPICPYLLLGLSRQCGCLLILFTHVSIFSIGKWK